MVDDHDQTDDVIDGAPSRRTFMQLTGGAALSTALLGAGGVAAADQQGEIDVEGLIDEMTLEEKASRTHGGSDGPAGIAGYVQGIERLDVPPLNMADGPGGASLGSATTDFPHPVAGAATFRPELAGRHGGATAREAKTADVSVLLAPSLDLFRVPTHARAGETYGEDPFLAGEMAREYTSAVQSEGTIATLKHFVAYNQASTTGQVYDYFSTSEHNVVVDERPLRELYCRPFREAVVEGGAGAVMPAYNRINGTYCSQHDHLLEEILRDDWGFDGFVVSDWGGTHSTVDAAVSGLDIEMPSANYFGEALADAVESDSLREGRIDEQVRRGLRSQHEIGAITGDRAGSEPALGTDEHFETAQQIAEEGSVLLKNEDDLLPLGDDVSEVALVGPDPSGFKQDVGGSDAVTAIREIGPGQGIEDVGDVSVTTVATDQYAAPDPSTLTPTTGEGEGFTARYYENDAWEGSPALSRTEEAVDLTESDLEQFDSDSVTVRWRATYTAPESGTFAFSLSSQAASRLSVDGSRIVDNEGGGFFGPKSEEATADLEAGETYEIVVEAVGTPPVSLAANLPSTVDDAVAAAEEADVALVHARTDTFYGDDRHEFVLPGNQNGLVEQVAAANEDTAVLLNTEAPVAMPWVDDVLAVLQAWFPGQEGGTALGNILFGEVAPSGKTPVTFAESMADYLPGEVTTLPDEGRTYPGESGNVFYDEGVFVGYRHFDEAGVEPLFPFGHGETYTTFEYGEPSLSRSETTPEEGVTVSVEVANAGEMDAREAVQVYVAEADPAVERPPKELEGIAKPQIPAGESRTVEVDLGRQAFEYWDPDAEDWTVDHGEFDVLIGASSRDVRGEATVSVLDSVSGGSEASASDTSTETSTDAGTDTPTDTATPTAASTKTTSGSGAGFGIGAAAVGVAAEMFRRLHEE